MCLYQCVTLVNPRVSETWLLNVELLKQIPHHNIILFSTTAHRELNDDYKFLQESKYAKIYPGSKDEIDDIKALQGYEEKEQ